MTGAALFRYAGAFLIFIVSVYLGAAAAAEYRARIERLSETELLIRRIRSQISALSVPVSEIIAGHVSETLEKSGFLPSLRMGDAAGAVNKLNCGGGGAFLEKFFENLGGGYREDEVKRCDAVLAELDDYIASLRSECAPKQKVCRAVGFLVGACAVIMAL